MNIEGNCPYTPTVNPTNGHSNEKPNGKLNEKIKNSVDGSSELFEKYQNEPLHVPYETTRTNSLYRVATKAGRADRGNSEKTFRFTVSPSAILQTQKAASLHSLIKDPNASQTDL